MNLIFALIWFQYLALALRGVFYEIFYTLREWSFAAMWCSVCRHAWLERFSKANIYMKWIYGELKDVFGRPVNSGAGSSIRVGATSHTKSVTAYNLGSYNYLGFGAETSGLCNEAVTTALEKYGASTTSPHAATGALDVTRELESVIVRFLRRDCSTSACIVFPMGHSTNASGIPALLKKGDVVFSDALNHNSIAMGCMSVPGVTVTRFKHNDMRDLEAKLQEALRKQYTLGTAPKRFVIIAEGIYSMEGDFCDLPALVALKKRYKAYLYIDEAHSIGCTGISGRGVCEHFFVDPNDVDVLMGTFSKSFAACGGYICSSAPVVRGLRARCGGELCDTGMSGVCAVQTLTSMRVIMGELDACGYASGAQRLEALRRNTRMLRQGLLEKGFKLMGNEASPVIPMMIYLPTAMAIFSRDCMNSGLAVVVVGYPATDFMTIRARFCASAGHTEDDMNAMLRIITRIGHRCMLDFNNPSAVETLVKTTKATIRHAVGKTLMCAQECTANGGWKTLFSREKKGVHVAIARAHKSL